MQKTAVPRPCSPRPFRLWHPDQTHPLDFCSSNHATMPRCRADATLRHGVVTAARPRSSLTRLTVFAPAGRNDSPLFLILPECGILSVYGPPRRWKLFIVSLDWYERACANAEQGIMKTCQCCAACSTPSYTRHQVVWSLLILQSSAVFDHTIILVNIYPMTGDCAASKCVF